MSEKSDAEKRQAEIVAEQEAAQSVPPYPSQKQIDKARLAMGDAADDEPEPVKVHEPKVPPTPEPTPAQIEKVAEAEKPVSGYKTRASKAN